MIEPASESTGQAIRIAVIDIGTNTTRLLVCEVEDGRVYELERRTEITRLGQGVDAGGRLVDEAKERVAATIGAYRDRIDALGAPRAVAVATSAVRDAENGDEFARELGKRFGVEVRTISGSEEARLTFLGATGARATEGGPALVVDIGGGSTELIIGTAGAGPTFDVSTRAGSVRQTERHIRDDPPSGESLSALADEIAGIVAEAVPRDLRSDVAAGIAVAGTATSLAAVSQQLEPYDSELVDGFVLELAEAERLLSMLATIPLDERRALAGLHPERASTIVAGAVILVECLRAFGLDRVEVSEADILHGAAIDATAGGSEAPA